MCSALPVLCEQLCNQEIEKNWSFSESSFVLCIVCLFSVYSVLLCDQKLDSTVNSSEAQLQTLALIGRNVLAAEVTPKTPEARPMTTHL